MAHKQREATARGDNGVTRGGVVEVDGAYIGGLVRQENRKEDRNDRSLLANRDADRRVVVVLRQRNGRTLPFGLDVRRNVGLMARRRISAQADLAASRAPAFKYSR